MRGTTWSPWLRPDLRGLGLSGSHVAWDSEPAALRYRWRWKVLELNLELMGAGTGGLVWDADGLLSVRVHGANRFAVMS